jgi:ribosomal-protein-alanine N-acetyltransferase
MAPNNSNSGTPMSHTTLRGYCPGDWQAMHALDLICFDPVFRFSRGAMRSFAEAPGAVIVLAEAERTLAGFCIAQLEDRTGYVVTLDVAPEWRRHGLARRLMAELESRLLTAGAVEMHLHVFSGNTAAICIYESIGYSQMCMAENFYAQGMHALLYRKPLDS